jgi:hypothetical protein
MSKALALLAEAPVFKGVDVGDVWSRGQTLKQGVIPILVIGAEYHRHHPALTGLIQGMCERGRHI